MTAISQQIPDTTQPARQHTNNFNFLRLVFASLVIVSHSTAMLYGYWRGDWLVRTTHNVSFGNIAVSGFFILSGYLIVQSWQRTPLLADFLKKRVLRIYPGFVCAFLISVLVVGYLGAQTSRYYAQINVSATLWSLATLGLPQTPPCFVGRPLDSVNGSLWTIRYEFMCYLLAALAGICCLLARRRLLLGLFAILLALHVMLTVQARLLHPLVTLLHVETFAVVGSLTFFLSGACFHLFRDKIRFDRRIAWAAGITLIVCLFEPHASRLAIPTCGAYALFYFAFLPIPMLQQVGQRADISYGIYLYGWPVQKLLMWYYPHIPEWGLMLTSLAGSVVCGLLSWRLVEQPFLRLKRKAKPSGV